MRKFSAALLIACLAVYLSLPACAPLAVPSTGGGQSSTSLGPDSVSVSESASTLPERMAASASELWSWYSALKSKVDPAVEPMRKLYVAAQEMVVAVQAQDWLKALSLGVTAWGLVDQVKGMMDK